MEIDPYEKQLLETARRVLQNSPYLTTSKKTLIQNLFDRIEEIYKKEDII